MKKYAIEEIYIVESFSEILKFYKEKDCRIEYNTADNEIGYLMQHPDDSNRNGSDKQSFYILFSNGSTIELEKYFNEDDTINEELMTNDFNLTDFTGYHTCIVKR